MPMTVGAKSALSKTIRALRERLLEDLHDATEGAYRLSVRPQDADLTAHRRHRRQQLERWLDAQAGRRARDDLRREVEKQAAYTLLNRLLILRLMEAPGPSGAPLRSPALVSGGWRSPAYRQLAEVAPALIDGDPTEGYAFLLQLVFEDLAVDLPGLYGSAGVADLIPVPPATLRHVVTALNDPALDTCWTDDMTLGWVYQYWNDPEREALDEKLNRREKLENHEIASKTQMFTERYMVDWLLQNTLNPMWLAICKKHGWTPRVQADGTLDRLEARRVDWRGRRARGEVALTAMMPLHTDAERRWAYTLEQPIPDEAPDSLRDIKILDPAAGSGHFLVVAVDLLLALYREEAAHRGADWSDAAIVERILSHNLHGIDLDPRAMQIAAAALWLKAKHLAPDARPSRLNLVAADLGLDDLPSALRGADHLGSLLQVDRAIEAASRRHPAGGLRERLERHLAAHTSREDLGLRLHGAQLSQGVRFLRMLRDGRYDLIVANPPYQGASKMADSSYIEAAYPLGKADLYAAFLLRGVELVREGGVSAMLTMRNWMFIKQYAPLRAHLLEHHGLLALGDFEAGAFEEVGGMVVSVCASVFRRGARQGRSIAQKLTLDRAQDSAGRTQRKRAATLCHEGRHTFAPAALQAVPEWPLVYWWPADFLRRYADAPKLGEVSPAKFGINTGNNTRFLRWRWEVPESSVPSIPRTSRAEVPASRWHRYLKGAAGVAWMDPCDEIAAWGDNGLMMKTYAERLYGSHSRQIRNERVYFKPGVAFAMIGSGFSGRLHRWRCIIDSKGSSVYHDDTAGIVCLMNRSETREVLAALNPSVSFQVGDVNRIAVFPVSSAAQIVQQLDQAFTAHESHREPSAEFRRPGPSPWRHAQAWAQAAVDRPDGTPLPPYTPQLDPEPPADHVSHALGVALGRFGPGGILDPTTDDLSRALPHGILLLDGTLDKAQISDDLGHPAAAPLHAAWTAHSARLGSRRDNLRDYLRLDFFKDVHAKMYEKRPIHWPLSSEKRTFVAWITIHRWTAGTLTELRAKLADVRRRLDGEISDQQDIRDRDADRRLDALRGWRAELVAFSEQITACAEQGPPPTTATCPPREQDARYVPDLDDGVMVNSAALWPLLLPQWKAPKKWWTELAKASGRRDHDWSRLAMRYFPARVGAKCRKDPSLGVAHGCFWRHHPARAWAWELRLQDEIGPDHRIEEADHAALRAAYLASKCAEAVAAVQKEALRRHGRGQDKRLVPEMTLLERGLWGRHPAACWDLEIAVSEKQGAEFFLRAPDEPEARAAFVAAHPERAAARAALVERLDAGAAQPANEIPPTDATNALS